MSKLTTRDHVWAAALDVRDELATRGTWGRRFDATDVAEALDDPPSNKTIRETLASMAELGHLDRGRRQGQYEAPEELVELLEIETTLENVQEERDDLRERIQDLEDELAESRPETPLVAVEGGGKGKPSREATADATTALGGPGAALATRSPTAAIVDLDLPGSGDLLEERRDLVVDVVRHLRDHGSASRAELLENVVEDELAAVGYGEGISAWKNLVQPALHDLADEIEAIRSPGEGGRRWRWIES